jgi:protein-tyrosine phosphatase
MIDSIVNFRDFGGASSRFGGRIKYDRLYRSGRLGTPPTGDLERLLNLDFALIADLRYVAEREDEPSPWPAAYAKRVYAHNGDRDAEAPHMAALRDGSMDEALAEQIYLKFYREIPFDPIYRPLFARILNALPDLDGRALVHCSAGKDRTGVLVALILHALGVPRDEIIADFMKSREARRLEALALPAAQRLQQKFGIQVRVELVRKLLDVEEHYLAAFFDEVERLCGSIDAYLDSAGLSQDRCERLRERLLIR